MFLRELEYELSRLTRKHLIHFDNDATSCYDRIPCFLANVASRKYGMHRKVCIVHGKTLQEARYHLKTKLGISDNYVTHSFEEPWFGTGQGSGNSPAYWLFICSTLFDLYEARAKGACYTSPDGSLEVDIKIIGFVDDTRNSTNDFMVTQQPNLQTIVNQASQDSQLWHDLLASSNQALELSKCGYHAIEYTFQEDGTPELINKPPTTLSVSDGNGSLLTIQQWESTDAAKYLGCYKTPANQKKQYEVLLKRCNDFATLVNGAGWSRAETVCIYRFIYKLSVGYPLSMTYFTYKELDKMQRKAHKAMMAKMGYNRCTATPVVYGPLYLGGASLFHLYDDQGYGQIRTFLKFWRTPNSKPGMLLRIAYAWAQFTVGTSISILQGSGTTHPHLNIPMKGIGAKHPHLESKWIASMRDYLRGVGGYMTLDTSYIPPLQRQNDLFLMDLVLDSVQFKPCDIRRINYCRLYLNVLLLSDITTASGREIDEAMYNGNRNKLCSYTNHISVHQARPGEKAWKQWRRLLNKLVEGRSKKLRQPLGKWLVPHHQQRRQWKHYYDPESDKVYTIGVEGYDVHDKITYDFEATSNGTISLLPETAVPTQIKDRGATWSLLGWKHLLPEEQDAPLASFADYVSTLDEWELRLLENLEILTDSEEELWEILTHEECILACDGSAPAPKGSFGWILSTATGRRLARCNGPAYGYKVNSYRSEGYGMLSGTRFLVRFQQWQARTHPIEITLKSHELICDNKSMGQVAMKHLKFLKIYPNSTLASEWDVIAEIRQSFLDLDPSSRPSIHHIKGHQDDEVEYDKLPLKAQLNVQADQLAADFIQQHPDFDYSRVPLLPSSGCQVELPKGTVTHNLKLELKHARTAPLLEAKLKHRNNWDDDTFESIAWDALGRALKRHDKRRPTYVKLLNDFLPVGKFVHAMDPRYPSTCPSCSGADGDGPPLETRQHLYYCQDTKRKEWRKKCAQAIAKYMRDKDTAPAIMDLVLVALESIFYSPTGIDERIPSDPRYHELHAAQERIGWQHFFKGRFSKKFIEFQDRHLGRQRTSKKNGLSWLTGLIDVIFKQWWELWELRNGDRHGRDLQSKAQAVNRQAVRDLELFYDRYQDTAPADLLWIFQEPLEVRKQWPSGSIIQWLNAWEPVLRESYATRLETG